MPTNPRKEAVIKYHFSKTAIIVSACLTASLSALAQAPSKPQAEASKPVVTADDFEQLGSRRFREGRFAESVAAFDQELKLAPQRATWHWKRGISLYYAGRYADGAVQFANYQMVDDNDVENAVWRFLCQARDPNVGVEAARQRLLPIKDDRRIPLMEIYRLFKGTSEPGKVLMNCRVDSPTDEELNQRLFYAHLYLGLFAEIEGRLDDAREHLKAANDRRIAHYMGDVAAVHLRLLNR